ncbi:MAG TPA: hypothetical protein DCZ05_07150 [Deltaproteobacteria bacterium]|nr:hypothetical protein [Deltaproteobacteria bacterium]
MRPCNQDKEVKDRKGYKPLRCICGSLLARLVSEGVELKCRRCKRHIIVPLKHPSGENTGEARE